MGFYHPILSKWCHLPNQNGCFFLPMKTCIKHYAKICAYYIWKHHIRISPNKQQKPIGIWPTRYLDVYVPLGRSLYVPFHWTGLDSEISRLTPFLMMEWWPCAKRHGSFNHSSEHQKIDQDFIYEGILSPSQASSCLMGQHLIHRTWRCEGSATPATNLWRCSTTTAGRLSGRLFRFPMDWWGHLHRKPWIFPLNLGLSCKLSRENQSMERFPIAPVIPPESSAPFGSSPAACCGVGVPRLFNMCIPSGKLT